MHLTLKQATLAPPAANPRRQQEMFRQFQQVYNHERPHEALGNQTPAACYVSSPRPMPRRVPEIEYPDDMLLRRVTHAGHLHWRGKPVFVSEIFGYETLGLRPCDDRYYQVLFGPVALGWLDTHRRRLERTRPRLLRD